MAMIGSLDVWIPLYEGPGIIDFMAVLLLWDRTSTLEFEFWRNSHEKFTATILDWRPVPSGIEIYAQEENGDKITISYSQTRSEPWWYDTESTKHPW